MAYFIITGILGHRDISRNNIQSFLSEIKPYHKVDLVRLAEHQPEMTFDNIQNGKVSHLACCF